MGFIAEAAAHDGDSGGPCYRVRNGSGAYIAGISVQIQTLVEVDCPYHSVEAMDISYGEDHLNVII